MAKRMKIDPYCQQQNCSPLGVLFSSVQIKSILLGVPTIIQCTYLCIS